MIKVLVKRRQDEDKLHLSNRVNKILEETNIVPIKAEFKTKNGREWGAPEILGIYVLFEKEDDAVLFKLSI